MASSPDVPWIDISRPLCPDSACWPGDVPYSYSLGWKIADGASVNVGSITTSLHTATHCDAPFHYQSDGNTVDAIPLNVFCGIALIVDVRPCLSNWLLALQALSGNVPSRILFHTGGWPDTSCFPNTIPTMTLPVVDWLMQHHVKLIGVDLPSVDELDSKELPIHHALGRAKITIVEGLWLEPVEAGEYELMAAPIRLTGTDGALLRALVRHS